MKLSKELLKHLTSINNVLTKLKDEGHIIDFEIEVNSEDQIIVTNKVRLKDNNVVECDTIVDINCLPEITSIVKLEKETITWK